MSFFRPEVRECRRCGATFVAKSERHYYCGEACRRQGSPRVKRVCEGCGHEFELEQYLAERGQGKFCSLDCYHNQSPRVEKVCQNCNAVFAASARSAAEGGRQFCSQKCQRDYFEAARVPRTCQFCGKEFTVIPSVAEKGGGKYCSKECADNAARDYVTVICEACGQTFSTPRSNINRGRGKFCSRECFERHAVVVATCLNCGQEFEAWQSELKYGRKFCSRRCYQLYEGESSIEKLVRVELERRGEEFIQEAEIGPYQVDFLLPWRMKVIECDGSYWHSLPDSIVRDRRKDTYLTRLGYRVYRLTEEDILKSSEAGISRVLGGC